MKSSDGTVRLRTIAPDTRIRLALKQTATNLQLPKAFQTKTGTLIDVPVSFYRNRGTSPKVPVLCENESTLHAKMGNNSKKMFLFRIWNKTHLAGKWRLKPDPAAQLPKRKYKYIDFGSTA